MKSLVAPGRIASAALAALLFALGCSPEPPAPVTDEPPTVPADDLPSTVVPPTSPPAQTSGSHPEMTSYEVAIAVAAANRKKAEADCEARQGTERKNCLAAISAEWDTTRTALEDLRGEQQ